MKLLHLSWVVDEGFYNNGVLHFWIETTKDTNKAPYYPFSANESTLERFILEYMKEQYMQKDMLTLMLPCTKDDSPIPSLLIANLLQQEEREVALLKAFHIPSLRVYDSLMFLKSLNFLSYYLDKSIQLADDAKFWIMVARELSKVVSFDQYIPSLVAKSAYKHDSYAPKWEIFSHEYKKNIERLAESMPKSASFHIDATPVSLVTHFCENELSKLIWQTPFPQKHIKMTAGSFLEEVISTSKAFYLNEETWRLWKKWRNNLAYDHFGAPFNLGMRVIAPESVDGKWYLSFFLQSKEDSAFILSLKDFEAAEDAEIKLYQKMFGTSIEKHLLLQLGYACRLYSPIERLFNKGLQMGSVSLSKEEAHQFLKEDAWTLHACGYRIIVPSWWTKKGRLKAKVKVKARASKNKREKLQDNPKGYLEYHNLVKFDYNYAMGEHDLTEEEWAVFLAAKSDLVFFKGQWVEVDPVEMERIASFMESSALVDHEGQIIDLLEVSANNEAYELELDDALSLVLNNINNHAGITELETPPALKAVLRDYQKRGLSWLHYMESIGLNPCLADDMGLGKTMQIIALLLHAPRELPALLVAPTSVIGNWYKEIMRFAPSLKALIYHGTKRKSKNTLSAVQKADIVITSFGLLRQEKGFFQSQKFSRIIVDEAQNIKNPLASQTKALCALDADSRIALTGTPVENRLMDLWSIFNFLNPDYLGAKNEFRKLFELPIQKENDARKTDVLKSMIEPFILRRVKSDQSIIKDLPAKVEQKVYCQLTKEQAALYQKVVDEVKYELDEEKENASAIFLSSLLRLKQICNHPAQLLQDGSEFSVKRSIKLERLLDMASEIIENGESLLIFSQFTEVCQELQRLIQKQNHPCYYLHGGTSRSKREKMIEMFQSKSSPPSAFVLSLKAGGVGVTLTKANHVIHFDRWWNPAVENQATDRAYRIGQKKSVFVHKYITLGTIEERIDQMIEDKKIVSDKIVGSGESWLSNLTTKSFMDLIQLKNEMVVE